jgi:RNA polymerase sigma factor (sigma-70 family)
MSESTAFPDFIRRIRAGDDQAARELVERYEPVIRCEVPLRLRDPRLYSRFDWTDICQSVMASFFARLSLGQYDLDQPSQLAALLARMARTKVATRARRADVTRRDARGQGVHTLAVRAVAANGPGPSDLVAGRDLLEQFLVRLTADERALSERRADGRSWSAIATELGGTPESLRKRLTRGLDRVACALGLDELFEV